MTSHQHRGDVLQVFTALAKSGKEFVGAYTYSTGGTSMHKEGHIALNCFHATVLRFIKDTK